ncbi:GL23404 [Drosophila persimilis]|uniref:GL23404 n=1 Tax=Drosophila persimilis TaxID=7234 RepID=B4G420_DROPE|nr:GL23404 [Drosophila persimilis]
MQAYRDNFKQTPCPSAVDLQAASSSSAAAPPPHPPSSNASTRLPFSRHQRGRDRDPSASGSGILTPRMMSPGPQPTAGAGESSTALLRQNQELRQRLADESHSYRRRLDTYKQAQHNQANLVSRLQSKIQQYRQRCSDLEDRMHETIKPTMAAGPKLTTGPTTSQVLCSTSLTLGGQNSLPCSSSLDSPPPSCSRDYGHEDGTSELCRKLEEEHLRCEQILAQNNALRQQLEESNRTNEALTNDLQKLTNDWSGLRDELLIKEDEFKEEEQAFKDYYNSEHNRLLKMWREVVAVKRSFKEMQSAMKQEVAKMGQEISCVGKDINGCTASVAFTQQQAKRAADEEIKQSHRISDELQHQLATLKVQYESARHEIMERDQRLLELMNQLKKLEDRCGQAESQAALASRYSDEIERLNNSMREIAQAVVQDAENADREADAEVTGGAMQHMHLTRDAASAAGTGTGTGTAGGGGKSPRRNSTRASQAFAEGTISAVQAALHKYQLALHDIQVKFQHTSETLRSTKSQLDTSEGTKQLLTTKMQQLTEKLDSSNSKLSELLQERDSLQKSLDDVRTQKQQSEMGRADINNAFESLSGEYEKLQLNYGKLQKRLDSMEEDKKAVELEIQRILKDKNITELNLRSEEDRSSRLREETISLREELNRVSLNRDLLEQQRIESDNLICLLEKQKSDLEIKLEECIRKQELQLCSIREERDTLCRVSEELKMEIRLKEDKMDGTNNELQDALRKTKEGEGFIDSLRKELTDSRRQLADSNIERDKYSNSNKELRDHVKRVESAKREQARAIEEALQKISSLEDSKNSLENERTRLSTILKETENHFTKTTQELNATKASLQKAQVEFAQKDEGGKELQCKLVAEVELKERAQQELCQIKKQLSDLEANLCATRQELARARCHSNQEEHRFHAREQEVAQRMEEARGREKRLEDQKHNLEVCLADATQQIQELKARLGGAEGRIRALDEQLSCVELHKRDTEQKLSSVVHTLRRIAGIQVDGSVNLSHRLLSPSRRFSPSRSVGDYDARSSSQCPDAPIDVDPDLVAQQEREKDDYKSQLGAAKKQLQDAAEQQLRCDAKLSKLQAMLRNLQEEKSNLETERKMKISAIYALEEKLKQRSDECQMLRERLAQTEMQLAATSEENGQNEERLEKCRQQCSKLDNEKRQLQEELAKVEGRASKLDLQRVAMEGDLTRLQMALQEKDCSIRQLSERLENQNRALTQLEDRCTSLKSTVDQLKERLQKSAVSETQLRGEIKTLQKELSEQGHCSQANEDKLKLLQKSLQTAENEKRILTERLDSSQTNLNELRRSQQAQLDGNQRLQDQVTDLEVQRSALESQLRIAKWNQESGGDKGLSNGNGNGAGGEEELSRQLKSSQREKSELRSKLQTLQDKVKQLECERKSKFSGGSAYDRAEKSNSYYGGGGGPADSGEFDSNRYDAGGTGGAGGGSYSCGLDHSVIEQETRDLRLKVRRLETLLAEKESELARVKARMNDSAKCMDGMDTERYRSAQMHAEKVLDVREQSHRQQVLRLENQISMLREQLAQEAKRRQQYVLRSSKANREMQHLRSTLGDSLRNVSQHPVDAHLLESESRRLDSAVSMSLPPSTCRDYDRD